RSARGLAQQDLAAHPRIGLSGAAGPGALPETSSRPRPPPPRRPAAADPLAGPGRPARRERRVVPRQAGGEGAGRRGGTPAPSSTGRAAPPPARPALTPRSAPSAPPRSAPPPAGSARPAGPAGRRPARRR